MSHLYARPAQAEIRSIQLLRFVAAMMVVVGHTLDTINRGHVEGLISVPALTFFPWHAGVDIFFVVSGFIMYYLMFDQFKKDGVPFRFLIRRIARVAPLYWLFTALTIASMAFLASEVNNDQIDIAHVIASALFIPWEAPNGGMIPPLSVGWTLNYEVFFYAIFSIALLFRRVTGLLFIAIIYTILIANHYFQDLPSQPLDTWGQPVALEFFFGMAIGHCFLKKTVFSDLVRLTLLVGGLGALVLVNVHGYDSFGNRWWAWGLPGSAIVAATVFGRDLPNSRLVRLCVLFGNASYALYLSHLFTIRATGLVWERLGLKGELTFTLLAVATSLLVSVLVYILIERPVARWVSVALARKQRRPPEMGAPDGSTS